MPRLSTEADFWSQVDQSGGPSVCWLWTGALKDGRYGTFKHKRRSMRTHRWAWEFANGPIPDGAHILHSCPDGDNTLCCNPTHLRPGTHQENMRDQTARGTNVPRTRAGGSRKLTVAQADEIRRRWVPRSPGVKANTAQLAAEFGVSGVMVWKIGTGRG